MLPVAENPIRKLLKFTTDFTNSQEKDMHKYAEAWKLQKMKISKKALKYSIFSS